MPTKVIYYQGTTETFLPPAVPRGALETADAPRTKRKRPIRSDDPDVLPPIAAPAVTAAPNGWESLDSPVVKRKRLRGEDTQLLFPSAAAPTGWDVADPLPRRRKPQRSEDSGLAFQAFVAPTGWDISDPRPFKRIAKQRDEAQLIIQPFTIPTGWEVEQRQRPVKRRQIQVEEALVLAPFVLDTFGWYQDAPTISRRRRRFGCDDDVLFDVPPPVVYDAYPTVDASAARHLADYHPARCHADSVAERHLASFISSAGLVNCKADWCSANYVAIKHIAD